jgi:ribose/xylose/arabinose/galactoside ABC-type transport system permease subunit
LTTIVVVALGGAAVGGGPGSAVATIAGAAFVVLLEQYFAIRSISGGVLVLAQGLALIGAASVLTLTSQGRLGVLLSEVRRLVQPFRYVRRRAT